VFYEDSVSQFVVDMMHYCDLNNKVAETKSRVMCVFAWLNFEQANLHRGHI